MAMVMDKDGKVRRFQVSDLKEVAERDERIKQLEKQCGVLAAEVDRMRVDEHDLSAAYLRLRRLIGREAFDTPHGPTGEQVWTTTEIALAKIVAEMDRQRVVVEAAQRWASMSYGEVDMVIIKENKLRDAVDTYEASREGDDGHNDNA